MSDRRQDLIRMSLAELAHRLGGEVSGNQVRCPGPGHRPEDRSLCVKVNPDGTWIVHSHAGDPIFDCKDLIREKAGLPAWNGKGNDSHTHLRKIVARFDYTDEDGNLLFQVEKYTPKKFVQRRPDGNGGWSWKLGDTRRVLYRLPAVIEAVANDHPIFICEGEKAVDALVKIGIPSSCSPHGAGKWRDEYSSHLKGAIVVVLPDNDEPGRQHAEQVAKSLHGVAASVKVLTLPGLPEGGDVYDWIQAGGTAEKLWGLVEAPQSESAPPLTLDEWLERDLPVLDRLLGDLLTTTCRVLIVGPTGLGKTMFGLAVALAMVTNKAFLHWKAGRKCRVLYVDGEMSRRELKRRLLDAVHRNGERGDGLCILSKEDYEDMPPLNTKQGQKWMDTFIEERGPFDLIIYDNVQALLEGNMKEEEQWAPMLPWVRSLTRRSIGQVWFHHTGHDETKSYGSKAREWQMDVVGLMERVEVPGADLAFTLKFTKARERTSENRNDFEPVTMSLQDDKWVHAQTPAPKKSLGLNERVMLGLLQDAMPEGLTQDDWNQKARDQGITTRQRLYEVKKGLKDRKLVHEYAGKWFVTK